MKWLITWIIATCSFVVVSFFLPSAFRFPFLWMTLGMAISALVFYFITIKSNPKQITGNLSAIILKFFLSAIVIIAFAIIFKPKSNIGYYFFILAYSVYSVISFVGAYYYKYKSTTIPKA